MLLGLLAKELSVEKKDILDVELTMCDTQPSAIGGLFDELIFGPRLDNQMHCFTSLEALLGFASSKTFAEDDMVSAICLFDHEEVGSQSSQELVQCSCATFSPRDSMPWRCEGHRSARLHRSNIRRWSARILSNYASSKTQKQSFNLNRTLERSSRQTRTCDTPNGFTGFVVREIARQETSHLKSTGIRRPPRLPVRHNNRLHSFCKLTGIRTVDIRYLYRCTVFMNLRHAVLLQTWIFCKRSFRV